MKEIKKIKSGFFARQFSLAKLAIKSKASDFLTIDTNLKDKLKENLEKHLDTVVSELGLMKGSVMKAGQMLSLYSGAFLSPEAQKILKTLESESSFLEWNVMKKRIPESWLPNLKIHERPIAAASLGQVHKVEVQGHPPLVMKIQYEGVKRAIDNDVKALKWIMNALNLLPKELDLSEIFSEVKEMLHQETDYETEIKNTQEFSKLIVDFPQYQIPQIIPDYSNSSIITSTFLDGVTPRSEEVKALSQEQRNFLGKEFMRLLFLEIFVWGVVQTDPHFGNYLVLNHEKAPKWGLLDFGATKRPPKEFLKSYQNLITSCALLDRELYFKTIKEMGYLSDKKTSNAELMWEYAELLSGPFKGGVYDWGSSPIPDKLFKFMPRFFTEISIGNPPRHALFIDRKIGGVFFMLKELGAQIDARELLMEYLPSKNTIES